MFIIWAARISALAVLFPDISVYLQLIKQFANWLTTAVPSKRWHRTHPPKINS